MENVKCFENIKLDLEHKNTTFENAKMKNIWGSHRMKEVLRAEKSFGPPSKHVGMKF